MKHYSDESEIDVLRDILDAQYDTESPSRPLAGGDQQDPLLYRRRQHFNSRPC